MHNKIVLLDYLSGRVSRLWWLSWFLQTKHWIDTTNALFIAILAFRSDAAKMDVDDRDALNKACDRANAVLERATRVWWN